MTLHANSHLSIVEIDGQEVQVVHRAQCRVCRSRHRAAVERGLIDGLSPSAIVSQLPVADVSARNIREHRRRGHLPIDQAAVRELQAKFRTGPASRLAFDATVREVASVGIAAAVVELVHARVRSGKIDVTIKDGLRAARVLAATDDWRRRVRAAEAMGRSIEQHRMRAIDRLLTLVAELGGEDLLGNLLAVAANDEALGQVLLDDRLRHRVGERQRAA